MDFVWAKLWLGLCFYHLTAKPELGPDRTANFYSGF